MINESITFDKLPQAVSYLTEQVIELKQMVSALQPTSSANNHILVEIDEAAIIIMKSKPTIYRLVNQGILPSYKKVRSYTSIRMSCLHGLRMVEKLPRSRTILKC